MDGGVGLEGEVAEVAGDAERWRALYYVSLFAVPPCEDVMEEERWKQPDVRRRSAGRWGWVATATGGDEEESERKRRLQEEANSEEMCDRGPSCLRLSETSSWWAGAGLGG